LSHPSSNVKGTKAVIETCVICSGIDQIGKGELLQTSKPLKGRTIDDVALMRLATNKAVDWISNFKVSRHFLMLGEWMAKDKYLLRHLPSLR